MRKVFVVHGFEGRPNGGWRPWLLGELAKNDVYAAALPMPAPDSPVKEEWVAEIARAVAQSPGDDVYLVGHSLGTPAILSYLTEAPAPVRGVVSVGGPWRKTALEVIAPFFDPPFDLPALRAKAKQFVIIHGDNDPLVPYEQGKALAEGLSGELVTVPGGGHLNAEAGWYELPQLRDALFSMMR